jgi:hypothetical protein
MVAVHSSTTTSPVSGSEMLQIVVSSCPVILNVGTWCSALLRTFSSDSGTIEKGAELILGGLGSGASMMNSIERLRFLLSMPRRTSTVITYWMLMKTPWYDSSSFSPSAGFSSISKSKSTPPSGSLPGGCSSAECMSSCTGLIDE